VERVEDFSDFAEGGADQPAGVCKRGHAGYLGSQFSHLPVAAVLGALLFFDILLLVVGLQQFEKKAVS